MEKCILYAEVCLVCILMMALIANKIRKSMFVQAQRRLFYIVVINLIIFLALDACWVFFDNKVFDAAISANWILNMAYFIISAILGYSWFLYSETVQNSKFVTDKKIGFIAIAPIIVIVVLTLLTPKTGLLFSIDENNVYHRGPLYFMQLLCSYGYVLFASISAFVRSQSSKEYQRKAEMVTLSVFGIPTLVAGVLQVIFVGYPVLCVGNTFSVLYVYLTLQEQLISIDPLTRLNNRNQFYQFYSTKIARYNGTNNIYLLIMDVDYFKTINDQYGHIEGDAALKYIAGALKNVSKNKNYFISRFGGDEFIMICELQPDESISKVCESIHSEMRKIDTPYKLTLSIGYAKYSSEIKNQQQFISMADAELYKVKKSRKKETE